MSFIAFTARRADQDHHHAVLRTSWSLEGLTFTTREELENWHEWQEEAAAELAAERYYENRGYDAARWQEEWEAARGIPA